MKLTSWLISPWCRIYALVYWSRGILQIYYSVNKMLKIIFFSFFTSVNSFYCIINQCMRFWLIMYHYSSYCIIIIRHKHHCPKYSETGGIYRFSIKFMTVMSRLVINTLQTAWNPTRSLEIHSRKCISICLLGNSGHFVQGEMIQTLQNRIHFGRSLRWSLLIHTDRGTPSRWLQMPWRQIGATSISAQPRWLY